MSDEATAAQPKKGTFRRNPDFPVGVDYYPLVEERRSWSDWYDREIEDDFKVIAQHGFAYVRVFISWKYFEPQVGQYDDDAEDRLAQLVTAARDAKLQLIVTFFADDRFSELTDVPWGKKRDAGTDDYLIQREVTLVQRIVSRYRSEQAIYAWDLANEAFLTRFATAEELEKWVATMREAIREGDTERPIFISADPETLFRVTGVDPRPAIDTCELAVSHVTAPYRAYAAEGPVTSGPATYLESFLTRSAARHLPVMLDGIGVLALDNSPAEEAAHVRTALYAGLMNRASAVVLRRFQDVETERREPYFRDPWEMLVGLVDTEGVPKPSLGEVRRFVRMVSGIDLTTHAHVTERVAVVIPAERYDPLPSMAGLYDPRSCLQAYISAKQAHIPVAIAREEDELAAYAVLIIPAAMTLRSKTWRRLATYVQGGGSLILSYGGSDLDPATRDIFGIEFLGDAGPRATLSCRVAQSGILGDLRSFDAKLEVPHYARLGQSGATVVATDATGSPLLTVNSHGQGKAVFMAAPIERALAQGDPWAAPDAVTALLRAVYGSIVNAAGAGLPIACDQPDVELALLTGHEDDILVMLNHAPHELTLSLTSERVVSTVADVRGGAAAPVGAHTFGVPLGPNGASALRLVYG